MGGSSSSDYNYDEALLNDTNMTKTIFVENSEEKGFSKIMRNASTPNGLKLPTFEQDGQTIPADTIWKAFTKSCNAFPENKCLGFRPWNGEERLRYKYMSYTDVRKTAIRLATALHNLGLKHQTSVGLYSKNRPEWMQVHLANQRQGYKTVALYDTLGEDAVNYILGHAEVEVAFCEVASLEKMKAAIGGEAAPKYVIAFDAQEIYGNQHEKVSRQMIQDFSDRNCKLMGLREFLDSGSACDAPEGKVDKRDTCFLMYTSGTTGKPKGVMLSHEGFCVCVAGVPYVVDFGPEDRHVSYLPLAHIFECLFETIMLACGGSIAYYQGNIKKLTNDWIEVKPTLIAGVPRIFSKIYDTVMKGRAEAGCFKRMIFDKFLKSSSIATRTGERDSSADSKLWSKVVQKTGFEECKVIISGAAPLPPYLAEFLRVICLNGKVIQGYGMTESTAGATIQYPDDYHLSHVGNPSPGVEVRLESIPEMGYNVTDEHPRGEILIRSPAVMTGYFKNKEATAKTVINGWLYTGDVGRINPNGTISIIDRKKNLFKTAFGEYIPVEKVESAYGKAPSVGQVWVYGNSYKSFVVAVVVPSAQWVRTFLESKSLWPADDFLPATPEYNAKFLELCQEHHEVVYAAVKADMKTFDGGLKKFERVKDIIMEYKIDELLAGFNEKNGLLTPTFKLKRPNLKRHYVEQLKELYTKNGEAPKPDEIWVNK